MKSILEFVHHVVGQALAPGARAVDATVGNGHDTCALAEAVGPGGQVWGFDVQAEALRATRRRLDERGLAGRVALFEKSHASMRDVLPPEATGRVRAVTFNLGYLPGGDKTCITMPESTLPALRAAAALLREGGVLTVVCYPGHDGGAEETRAVHAWAEGLARERFRVLGYRFLNPSGDPPRLVVVEKTPDD